MRWIYLEKEATVFSLQDLHSTFNVRAFWRSLIHTVTVSQKGLDSTEEQHIEGGSLLPMSRAQRRYDNSPGFHNCHIEASGSGSTLTVDLLLHELRKNSMLSYVLEIPPER